MRLKLTALALLSTICTLAMHTTASATTVVRSQYIVFSDRADLNSYLQDAFPDFYSKLAPYTDPRYARAEAILQRVWSGYQKLSPSNTDQLPTPALVILKGKFIDGFVTADPKSHLFPNAFFIYERVTERPDEEIAGFMAHELTHLLTPVFRYKYYQVSAGQEPLGYLQANDPNVESVVKQWQSITQIVGPVFIPEPNGLPAPIVYDGQLFNIIGPMAAKWGDPLKPECQTVQNPLPSWRIDLVLHYLSAIDQTVRMTNAERVEMDRQTSNYISDLRACIGQQQGKLIPILEELLHLPVTELEVKYGEVEKIFDSAANVVDGLFAVAGAEYQKLNTFVSEGFC